MGRKRHRDNDPDDRNFKRIWNQFLPELITGTVAALISAGGDRIFENGLPRLIVFFLIVAASIVGREICKSLRKRGRNGTAKKIRIRIIIGLAVFCLINWNSVKLLAGDFVHLMDYTYYNMYKSQFNI